MLGLTGDPQTVQLVNATTTYICIPLPFKLQIINGGVFLPCVQVEGTRPPVQPSTKQRTKWAMSAPGVAPVWNFLKVSGPQLTYIYIYTYLLIGQVSLCLPTKLCFSQANLSELRSCVKVEVDVLGLPVPNSPYGFCRRKATLNKGNPTLSMAGSSTSSVVERWTCDQKVESSSPCRSSGKMVFSGVNVLC